MNQELFFDTIGIKNSVIENINNHLTRALKTASFLNLSKEELTQINQFYHKLENLKYPATSSVQKLRVSFQRKQNKLAIAYEITPYIFNKGVTYLNFDPDAVIDSQDLSNRWKISSNLQRKYDPNTLFCNERGYVTETSIANIYLLQDKILLTPPLSDGCLDGTVRRECLLNRVEIEGVNYPVKEFSITKEKFADFRETIFISNSLLGFISAKLKF